MRSLLLSFLLLLGSVTTMAQFTYSNLVVDYDSAITYKNLKIIPIYRGGGGGNIPLVSLSYAMKKGWATITERGTASTENVHWVRINNTSTHPIYVAGGEILVGGRQDRMVTRDTILMPAGGADQYISVMCIEEDRWSEKEKKFSYFSYANPSLRKILETTHNQVLIWKEIYGQLDSLKIPSPTLTYTSERSDKLLMQEMAQYRNYMDRVISKRDSNWVGMIAVSGNRVLGLEAFLTKELFYQHSSYLLDAFIEEAVSFGSKLAKTDEEIAQYIDPALISEASQQQYLKTHGKLTYYQLKPFRLTLFSQ